MEILKSPCIFHQTCDNEIKMLANTTFTTWLIEERQKKGLTTESVAKLAEIPAEDYSRIEEGRKRPSLRMCRAIAKVFNVSCEDVLRAAGKLSAYKRSIRGIFSTCCWIFDLKCSDCVDMDRFIRFA